MGESGIQESVWERQTERHTLFAGGALTGSTDTGTQKKPYQIRLNEERSIV